MEPCKQLVRAGAVELRYLRRENDLLRAQLLGATAGRMETGSGVNSPQLPCKSSLLRLPHPSLLELWQDLCMQVEKAGICPLSVPLRLPRSLTLACCRHALPRLRECFQALCSFWVPS